MLHVPVFWTEYTATAHGKTLKSVTCENCSTEYLYLMERESTGAGTSVYFTNEGGAAGHAVGAAQDTLQSVLDNDFDAVPCPVCGHYQRFMFPKLMETKSLWEPAARILILVVGVVAGLTVAAAALGYVSGPNDRDLRRMIVAGAVVLLAGLAGLGLAAVVRARARNFDPNTHDPQEQAARIALGRSRAVTRMEFEQEKGRHAPHRNRS